MIYFFQSFNPITQAFIATLFIWGMTALAVTFIEPLLPYALSFAAGAMIFVVVEEVIPSSQEKGNKDLASMSLMVGFVLMMIPDVALG